MADLQVKPEEEKLETGLSDDNVLASLDGESVKPTDISVKQDLFSDDSILEFLNGHNVSDFIDLRPTQVALTSDSSYPTDSSIVDQPNLTDFFDLPGDLLRTGDNSYPSNFSVFDLGQITEDLKHSNNKASVTTNQDDKSIQTRPIPLCNPQTNLFYECDPSGKSFRKHKLDVVSEGEGSASKSSKMDHTKLELKMPTGECSNKILNNDHFENSNYSSSFNEQVGFSHFNSTGPNHITRNHTVTSADVNTDLNNICYLPDRMGLEFYSPEIHPEYPVGLPKSQEWFYPTIGPSESRPSAIPSLCSDRSTPQLDVLCNKLTFPETKHNSVGSGLSVENIDDSIKAQPICTGINKTHHAHDPSFFCQLLEVFPDIEENFLRNTCHGKTDLNQVIDSILEMNNNYPKVRSSKPDLKSNPIPRYRTKDSINMLSLYETPTLSYPDVNLNSAASRFGKTPTLPTKDQNHEPHLCKQEKYLESKTCPVVESFPTIGDQTEIFEVPSNKPSPVNSSQCLNLQGTVDEQNDESKKFDFLIKIFPDADPAFLQTKCKLGESDIRHFISEALEKNDYLKVVIKEEKKVEDSEEKDLGLYTTSFDVEKFLNIFQEPFKYFFDEKRICQPNQHCLEFMKRRYRNHAVKLITKKYAEYKFNLTKTCEFLDSAKPSRSTKRCLQEIIMPNTTNLPFMQEACFVEHKSEIKKYFDNQEEARKVAYLQAEQKGELMECGCCYGEFLFEECEACNEGDLFCKTCIQKSAEIRIGDGFTTFPCLSACGSVFSMQMLQDLLDAQVFSRLLKRIQLDEVKAADIEGLEICPFCEFATIPPPETNIFTCLEPECLKESCRKCHKLSHIPLRCDEIESDDQERARKYIEDEMTKALVRQCYKCKKNFIKSDGCNKMTCSCGAKMCYICRQPITDYKHFNGQGGTETGKCPLYSSEQVLHVDAIKAVAEETLKKVKEDNPGLKLTHDPTKVLPKAPSVSRPLPPGINEVPQRLIAVLYQNHRRLENAGFQD